MSSSQSHSASVDSGVKTGGQSRLPKRQRIILALMLPLAAVFVVVPNIYKILLLADVWIMLLCAEILEYTGGLKTSVYGSAFGVSCTLIAIGFVGGWVIRYLSSDKKPKWWMWVIGRPSISILAFILAAIILFLPFAFGQGGPPVIPTTILAISTLGYFLFVMPIAMLGWLWKGAIATWRWGNSSIYRGGLVIGASVSLCALEFMLLPAAWLIDESGNYDEVEYIFEKLERTSGRDDVTEDTLAVLSNISNEFEIASFDSSNFDANHSDRRVHRCMEELAQNVGNQRSTIYDSIARLVRRGVRPDIAEDVVYQTLILVCVRHGNEPLKGKLIHYFERAVSQNSTKNWYRQQREHQEDACRFFSDDAFYSPPYDETPEDRLMRAEQLRRLNEAYCELEPLYRTVMEMHLSGLEPIEIADHLGIAPDLARQRLKRAREKLKKALP